MRRDPPPVELRHLRYFLAVMDELHFGRAAARLNMAQPPLSRAIRKLEDGLGVQLLVRSSRSVAPTEAGRAFAAEARKVLAGVDAAIAEARRAGGAGGELRVGCVHYLPAPGIQAFLHALRERDEALTVEVTHLPTLELVRRLRTGELDLALYNDAGEQPDIATEPLFPGEPVAAFLGDAHALAAAEVIRPGDVAGETLAVFPRLGNPGFYANWITMLEEAGFHFAHVSEAPSLHPLDNMLHTVQCGGILMAPAFFRDEGSADDVDVTMVPVEPALTMRDTSIAWVPKALNGRKTTLAAARAAAAALYREAPLDG